MPPLDDLAYRPAMSPEMIRPGDLSGLLMAAFQGYGPAIAELARHGIRIDDLRRSVERAPAAPPSGDTTAAGGPGADRDAAHMLAEAIAPETPVARATPDIPLPPGRKPPVPAAVGGPEEEHAAARLLAEAIAPETPVARATPDIPLTMAVPNPPGLVEPGNIDLAHRPVVRNPDGSVSSVRSISFDEDGMEVLIPTVSDDGRIMTNGEAIAEYKRTRRHLGKFKDPASADAYAEALHRQQEQMYIGKPTLGIKQLAPQQGIPLPPGRKPRVVVHETVVAGALPPGSIRRVAEMMRRSAMGVGMPIPLLAGTEKAAAEPAPSGRKSAPDRRAYGYEQRGRRK